MNSSVETLENEKTKTSKKDWSTPLLKQVNVSDDTKNNGGSGPDSVENSS